MWGTWGGAMNCFPAAVCLFRNRSQEMSKCDKNLKPNSLCDTFLLLPPFKVILTFALRILFAHNLRRHLACARARTY